MTDPEPGANIDTGDGDRRREVREHPAPAQMDVAMAGSPGLAAATVDIQGVVVRINDHWHGDEPGLGVLAETTVGTNLLEHCQAAGTMMGRTIAAGLGAVLSGARNGFCHEYVSRSANGNRRFMLAITPSAGASGGATVLLFDVSAESADATVSDGFDWVFRQCLSDIFMFDGESLNFLQVSEGALRNLGYSSDEMLAMTPVEIEPGATVESFRERLKPLRTKATPKTLWVSVFRRRDGTTYPVEVQLQRLEVAGRAVYFAIAMDLTRGTATEQLMNEATAVLESTPDAMVIVDRDGRIRVANGRMASLFGYAPDELRGMQIDTLLPPRLRASQSLQGATFDHANAARALRANIGLAALTKGGRELPVEVSLSPVTTREGTLVAAAIRDMSDVERTRRALSESEERYRDLFENASDIIQIVSTSGSLVYVNRSWCRALGYDSQQAHSMSVYDTMDEPQRDLARATLERLQAGGPLEEVAWRLRTAAGNVLEFEGSVDGQRSGGDIVGFRAILHDVTHRNAYEAALVEAKTRAEQSAATKSRFLAAAGHDLRQPLQSLGLYLAVLSRRVEDPLVEEIGRKMRVSVDVMASLLDALLDISRFDAGMIVPRRRDFELASLLNRVVNDNVQQARRKGLTLSCGQCKYVVNSDPALLERIVENFVTNAIRYTETGHIDIGCELVGRDMLRIRVRDTGIGIAASEVEQIFEEYYQVGNSARESGRGLGLGLSIVKHVARLLDLSVDVSSTPGKGSVFSIDVPLGDADTLRVASRHASAVRETRNDRRSVVLVVDNDASIVDAASMFLDLAGYTVCSAQTRDQVESILDAGTVPDVLVTDYRLPDVSGVDLVRRVRHRVDKSVPAILITGDTSLTDLDAARLPQSQIMRKPIKTDALLSLIDQATRG